MKLSIVIPAHNEEGSLTETLTQLNAVLRQQRISHEILVVNDHSKDNTEQVLIQCFTNEC